MSYNTSRPYLAAFMILRRESKVALILRTNTDWMNGYYGLPAGKVEIGERAAAAALREAQEEVGVLINEADIQCVHVCHRYADDDTLAWLDVIFETEKWEGEPKNNETHKHGELTWFDLNNLPQNTIPVVKYYFQQIAAGNTYSEFGWENA